ncbi:11782_t:CDS:2, partial [Funneliformis geosporum]
ITANGPLVTKRNFAVAGYYANGPLVTFVAICRPPESHDMPNIINIVNSNLALRWERIFHLRRIINLSIIIELVQEVIGFHETAEFIPIVREGRQIIEVCGKNIKKTYISPDAHDRVEMLVNIYGKLMQKGVPNVDRLDHADKEKDVVYLSPKGMSLNPKNQQELLDSITCVLEMLVVLHDNEPIYHQDIRWPNIIQLPNALDVPSKWIIIDWKDSDGYPNNLADHLTQDEHAPEVFQQNHGGEVDIWSVGKLIMDANRWIIGLSQRITQFGRDLQSDDRPSAKKALKRFKKIKRKIS